MISYREILVMLVGGSIVFLVLAGILIFILLFYQKKRFSLSQQMLEIDKQHSEALLQSRIEIQEETFKNISQEIHDNIGQVLSFVKLNLNGITSVQLESDKEKMTESIALVAKSIRDLRDVAKSINTDYVSQIGLSEAIKQQLHILQKSGAFETKFEEHGIVKSLEKQNELILFRVVQELLNNIVKHAEAALIDTQLFYKNDMIEIQVSDNGKGFDTDAINEPRKSSAGLGLSNMRSRILLINGQFTIKSTLGEGTVVLIKVPCG
jgi:two-component system NarL family sensor kinase